MSNRVLWISLLVGSMLSMAVSYKIAMQSILLGSREGRWVYPYIQPFSARPLAVFLIVSVLAGSLVAVHDSLARRGEWLPVLVWVIVALGFQGLLRSLTPYSFE